MTFFNCYLGMLLHSMKVEAHHRLDAKFDQIFSANFIVNKNLKNFKLKANETKSNHVISNKKNLKHHLFHALNSF